jgi:hypothetical protein
VRVIRVASVVAGHGEVASVPILLQRIGTELLSDVWLEALKPIRQPQQRLSSNKDDALLKAIGLAHQKLTLGQKSDAEKLILVLIDAEEELPCVAGPRITKIAASSGCNCPIVSVVANYEFETWFVAAAASLGAYLDCDDQFPKDPERQRCGKGWIASRFRRGRYSETVDQPRLTAAMDLSLCRNNSSSFDKLCRELAVI